MDTDNPITSSDGEIGVEMTPFPRRFPDSSLLMEEKHRRGGVRGFPTKFSEFERATGMRNVWESGWAFLGFFNKILHQTDEIMDKQKG